MAFNSSTKTLTRKANLTHDCTPNKRIRLWEKERKAANA